ncbi:MAG TPA: transglutaminase domain-containing protein [Kofleriaceae bacterium]|nr:transglutaminase domain-containing protein [Kofleriaceae bacterium]
MRPAFSIVIVTSAGAAGPPQLARLLPALAALEPPSGGFEVITVGDGAGLEALAPLQAGALALRRLPDPGIGRARCRELGWRAASGDVIVFLDPDMIVGPGWLRAYERALADGADVVSGARWWLPGDAAAGASAAADELRARAQPGAHGGPAFRALERQLDSLCRRAPANVLVAFAAQASNLAVRRRALEQTSGFNVCLRRFEDIELGIRLWQTGARFACSSEAWAVRCIGDGADGAWLDDVEAQALFWRHPYGDLLRLQVWARRCEAGAAAAGAAAPATLDWLDQPWDPEELRRELGEAGPGPQTWAEADLVAQLAQSQQVPIPQMQDQITRGVAAGLYHEVRDGVRYFQLDRLEDWLRDATPYLQRNYHNDQVLVMFRENPDVGTPATLLARGQLQISLDPDALARAGVDRLNIPLPVERCGQRAVEILSASTPALLAAARQGRGMLAGFPVAEAAAGGGGAFSLELQFQFQVSAPMSGGPDDVDPATQLRAVMPPEYQARAQAIVRSLGPAADPFEAGRALFEWIEGHVIFGGLPPQHPYYRVLDFGAGICIQQIRLFVAMCRVAQIPAREVCGALFPLGGEGEAQVRKQVCTRGFSPFGHSWAEYFVPGRGWVPAELRGFGRRGFIPLTVPDPALRRELQRVLYERYPFGALHPYRVVSGPQANRLAPFQLPAGADPAAAKRALDSLVYDVVCTFTRGSAA